LDDTDLQRDVAEQVMASTTMTKLELEEDDADFFVNVGNLEVEDNEYGDQYDPLEDKEQTTKKRKKAAPAKPGEPAKKKAKQDELDKSTKSKSSVASKKKKPSLGSTAGSTKEDTEEKKKKTKAAKEAKAMAEKYFKKFAKLVKALTEDELPRRKTKRKVALTCPPNKKPGDDITFTYVHDFIFLAILLPLTFWLSFSLLATRTIQASDCASRCRKTAIQAVPSRSLFLSSSRRPTRTKMGQIITSSLGSFKNCWMILLGHTMIGASCNQKSTRCLPFTRKSN
jgi:hypothetical protein